MTTIEARDLRVSYGPLEAVAGIDLEIDEGEVFALLGPNGAGKTTTVEVLEGFRAPTSGSVSVLGADPRTTDVVWRRQIGVVLQEAAVEPYLTVTEVIDRNGAYYDDPLGTDEVIEKVGLTEKATTRVLKLSGGQQRRLDVGLGIVGRPRLLFLDEPTTGFDPAARRGAWDLVRSLREGGTTVVLTTHYMDEAQALADRLAVIDHGVIVASGTPADIGGRSDAATRIRFRVPAGGLPGGFVVDDGWAVLRTDDPTRALHDVTGWALDQAVPLVDLTVDRPSLEDVYLQLTSEGTA